MIYTLSSAHWQQASKLSTERTEHGATVLYTRLHHRHQLKCIQEYPKLYYSRIYTCYEEASEVLLVVGTVDLE